MQRKKFSKLIILVFLFVITGLVVIFGLQQNYEMKLFKTFRTDINSENEKQIILINPITTQESKEQWHIKAYFDGNGELIKFENYNKDGKLYDINYNTNSFKVKIK